MPENSLLDAPTDQKTGADDKDTGSLLDTDTKPATNADGKDGAKTPSSSSDKTPPADPLTKTDAKPTDKPAAVVPEKYAEFKLPAGQSLNAEALTKFDAACKDLGLPQEKRDSLLAIQVEHTNAQIKETMDQFNKQIEEWTDQTKKELGSDPAKSLAVASKAIDRIFSHPKQNQEFREMMKTTGLGNWRLMVKAFSYVGKAISEDTFVDGKPNSKEEKTIAERIYESSAK